MAEILNFEDFRDPAELDRKELLALLEATRLRIDELDAAEPKDMMSEEYEEWGEAHEDLEDLMDEIFERLELLD